MRENSPLLVDAHETGWIEAWWYPTLAAAVAAALEWDGEGDAPGPWIRTTYGATEHRFRRRDPETGREWEAP